MNRAAREILEQKRRILKEVGKYRTNKVAVEIHGELMYMAEYDIRAMQVLAARKARESKEAFAEFCKSVTVYSGRYKRSSDHTMIFREDGCFSNDFEEGFFDVNANLTFEIL